MRGIRLGPPRYAGNFVLYLSCPSPPPGFNGLAVCMEASWRLSLDTKVSWKLFYRRRPGENVVDVVSAINVMLARGDIPGGAAKITVPVLAGSRRTDQVGLIERILRRKAVAAHLLQTYPFEGDQHAIVQKFATFQNFNLNVPSSKQTMTKTVGRPHLDGVANACLPVANGPIEEDLGG